MMAPVRFELMLAKVLLPTFVGLFLLAGCSSTLVGNWTAVEPVPQDAEFHVMQANFKEEGDFVISARTKGSDVPVNERGKYEFNGFQLKLMQPGKADRVYSATYVSMTNPHTLEITKDGKKQVLQKQ